VEIAKVDGRTARAARSRAQVADALLQLIDEGDLRPTAERIAERAGVSLRLVFHHFRDLDALFSAAALRQMERVLPTVRPISIDGPLAARVEALVAERARLYERVGNVRRAAMLVEPFSTEVAVRLMQVRALKRGECDRVFARELARLPLEERIIVSTAVGTAASFSTWDALRNHQSLSLAVARRVMARMIMALLEAGK
jgi:TetR/AcrR family transcriptional regulator, regulator of autoinduction and epiphytic fitness